MKPGLSLRVSQHLSLTPQLQQSIRLLQLSTLELSQEVEQMLDENPFLERTAEEAPREEFGLEAADTPAQTDDYSADDAIFSGATSASSTSASSASDASSAGSTSSDSTASEEYASPSDVDGIPVVDEEVDPAECVTLGDYKKLTLEKKVEQVTDDDVQTAIMAETAVTMDDPDATVQKGDTADIAYVGKVDGKEFDGGSSDSYNLVIGSGTFIDGFEDGVIGMKTGETKDLNLKFPDSYQSTDLAGKDVVFTVTVNAFTRPAENIDGWELDDAWVAKNTDYSTVEEYRAGKRAELEAANETTAENNLQDDAMKQVADGCTFTKIPKSYVTLGEEDYDKRYTSYLQNYGISLDDYLEQYADRATYNQEKATYAGTMAKSALLLDAVKEAEGWTTDDQDYQQILNDEAANANMSQEDFLKAANDYYGEDTVVRNIMMERMINMVLDNATVNTVTVDADGNTVE